MVVPCSSLGASNALAIYGWRCLMSSFCFTFFCRDGLEGYTSDYTLQVLIGYCMVYIFMQTFMIPGTVFMSLLAGALFGVFKGVALVVFTATAGASSCYFLSKMIGRPIVFCLWPEKLSFFQAQVSWYLVVLFILGCPAFLLGTFGCHYLKANSVTFRWPKGENGCWTICFSWGSHQLCPTRSSTLLHL